MNVSKGTYANKYAIYFEKETGSSYKNFTIKLPSDNY